MLFLPTGIFYLYNDYDKYYSCISMADRPHVILGNLLLLEIKMITKSSHLPLLSQHSRGIQFASVANKKLQMWLLHRFVDFYIKF